MMVLMAKTISYECKITLQDPVEAREHITAWWPMGLNNEMNTWHHEGIDGTMRALMAP